MEAKIVDYLIEAERRAMEKKMIAYLQSMMDDFKKEEAIYGIEDRSVENILDCMIACKDMVEALIGKPVNLGIDGKVTVGF